MCKYTGVQWLSPFHHQLLPLSCPMSTVPPTLDSSACLEIDIDNDNDDCDLLVIVRDSYDNELSYTAIPYLRADYIDYEDAHDYTLRTKRDGGQSIPLCSYFEIHLIYFNDSKHKLKTNITTVVWISPNVQAPSLFLSHSLILLHTPIFALVLFIVRQNVLQFLDFQPFTNVLRVS